VSVCVSLCVCAHPDLDKASDSVHMHAYACVRDVTNGRIKNIEARAGGFDTTEGEYRFG
jgi:hypothetical protein